MIARGRSAAFLLLSVLYLTLYAPPASASDGDGTVQPLFVIQFTTGPAWLAGKPFQDQPMAAEHSLNLRRLREQGILVVGARYGSTGMIILRASSEAAARSEIEKDPTIAKGVFTYSIDVFKPFYGGCIELPPPATKKSGVAETPRRFGVVTWSDGEQPCATFSEDVAVGASVSIIVFDPQSNTAGTIARRRDKPCREPADIAGTNYEVEAEPKDQGSEIGIAVVGPTEGLTLKMCASSEGLHLTAWEGTRRVWHEDYYLGYDVEANCTEAESAD